jgi:hypothetical protein
MRQLQLFCLVAFMLTALSVNVLSGMVALVPAGSHAMKLIIAESSAADERMHLSYKGRRALARGARPIASFANRARMSGSRVHDLLTTLPRRSRIRNPNESEENPAGPRSTKTKRATAAGIKPDTKKVIISAAQKKPQDPAKEVFMSILLP